MTYKLDTIDRKIIDQLTHDARQPIAEIARRVGLSKTPVAARIKHLEDIGLITGYRAVLNPIQMGLSHVAYVEVKVSDTRQAALAKFNAAAKLVPEIEECYMIAGGFDYLLKVRSSDIADYRRIMGEKISALPYVNSTSTYVAMEAVIEQGAFSIG
jgi:Lrp/AsnC family transcriptional regulator, leucine-responsive regulatory protein